MKKKVTYRPSKAQSLLGGVVGVAFVLIGLFVVIPQVGLFGLLWTGMAVAITAINFYHAFGKGYIGPKIEIEDEGQPPGGDRRGAAEEAPDPLRPAPHHSRGV